MVVSAALGMGAEVGTPPTGVSGVLLLKKIFLITSKMVHFRDFWNILKLTTLYPAGRGNWGIPPPHYCSHITKFGHVHWL